MVFIGYDHNSVPISVVSARSKELAEAYWQGKGGLPHCSKCLEKDFMSLDEHMTGVIPIVETKEINLGDVFKPNLKRVITK